MQIQLDRNSFYQADAAVVVAAAAEWHPRPAVRSEVILGHPQQLVYWTEYLLMKDSSGVHYFHSWSLHPAGVVSASPNYFVALKIKRNRWVFTLHRIRSLAVRQLFLNT